MNATINKLLIRKFFRILDIPLEIFDGNLDIWLLVLSLGFLGLGLVLWSISGSQVVDVAFFVMLGRLLVPKFGDQPKLFKSGCILLSRLFTCNFHFRFFGFGFPFL